MATAAIVGRAAAAGMGRRGGTGAFAFPARGDGAAGDQLGHLGAAALFALDRGGGRQRTQELLELGAAFPAFIIIYRHRAFPLDSFYSSRPIL